MNEWISFGLIYSNFNWVIEENVGKWTDELRYTLMAICNLKLMFKLSQLIILITD